MGNNMAKVSMSHHREQRNSENGKRGRELSGLVETMKNDINLAYIIIIMELINSLLAKNVSLKYYIYISQIFIILHCFHQST